MAFQGPTADLAALATGTVWIITCPPGTSAPNLPTVTVAPVPNGMQYRVISPIPPAPDAQMVHPTAEDGYLTLMLQGQQTLEQSTYSQALDITATGRRRRQL